MNELDVLVVGGGVVGLSAAIAMATRNLSVTLLDAADDISPSLDSISRVYAINKLSEQLFRKLQIWDLIDTKQISSYNRMHIWDNSNSSSIDFDSKVIGSNKLGVMLEERVIKQALIKRASELNIKLISKCNVSSIVENIENISVTDSQNRTFTAKLLIISDGAKSALREKLNVKITSWPYSQNAIIANVETTQSHLETAYQVFLTDGPLAFLPMANTHNSSIVWSTSPEKAKKLMTISDEEFNIELTKNIGDKLGNIKLLSKRYSFPLHMRHVKQYTGRNWLLMGDAAHTIHPLAGLGLNVGLADLNAWIEILDSNNLGLTSFRNLKSYQRKRKHALWGVIALMQGLHTLFLNNFSPVVMLRGLGLSAVNKLVPIKKRIVEHASGCGF